MNRRSFFKFGAALPAAAAATALPVKTIDVEEEVPIMCTSDCPNRPERYGINSYHQRVHLVPGNPHQHPHSHTISPSHSHGFSVEAVPCTCRRQRVKT
jgi:hypothetical protein